MQLNEENSYIHPCFIMSSFGDRGVRAEASEMHSKLSCGLIALASGVWQIKHKAPSAVEKQSSQSDEGRWPFCSAASSGLQPFHCG